jgi:hypothetical protein
MKRTTDTIPPIRTGNIQPRWMPLYLTAFIVGMIVLWSLIIYNLCK